MYNKLVIAPGNNLKLGASGGVLLLSPPAEIPGAMNLTNLQNRTWHLLREDGPDTGYPIPTTGDFNVTVVTRDLNIALAQFLSQTGVAPALSDRMDTFFVLPLLDHPLPPSLVSLSRIEYTPAGQQLYKLIPYGMQQFDNEFGSVLPSNTGQPYYYRAPYAGYVRLQPQPGLGNSVGPGIGTLTLSGTPVAGQTIRATLTNGGTTVNTASYTITATDTLATIAFQISNLINASAAVSGVNSFLSPTSPAGNIVNLTALLAPGTQITSFAVVTGAGFAASPTTATSLTPNGDQITFYYSSLGTILALPGDTPGIPPQFHMALVYRVLTDYWRRKQDLAMAKEYFEAYKEEVLRAKSYAYDLDRATGPTMAGEDFDESAWQLGGG